MPFVWCVRYVAYCNTVLQELSLLQDRVPAFSPDRAIGTVEEELGAPVTQLFRSFERSPIAAASLGQVSDRTALSASEPVPYAADRPPPCLQHLSQASLQDSGLPLRWYYMLRRLSHDELQNFPPLTFKLQVYPYEKPI